MLSRTPTTNYAVCLWLSGHSPPRLGVVDFIANEVVHALIQHFKEHDLSNKSVPSDVLGGAYEYLIKRFADDAGAKAGLRALVD